MQNINQESNNLNNDTSSTMENNMQRLGLAVINTGLYLNDWECKYDQLTDFLRGNLR